MKLPKPSYCVRCAAASILSISFALTQISASAQTVAAPVAPVGPLQTFDPRTAFTSANPQRYPFCPAALQPNSYAEPDKQVLEGDAGWFFLQGEIDWDAALSPGFFGDVRRIADTLAKRGTKLIVLIPPPRSVLGYTHLPLLVKQTSARQQDGQLRGYLALLDRIRLSGAIVPDVLGEARRHNLSFDQIGSPAEPHWSPAGSWAAALAITRQIAPERLKQGEPAVRGTRVAEVSGASYTDALNKICKTKWPRQAIPAFLVAEDPALAGGGDLLGGGAETDIVLVGTSFTAQTERYSFAPFLEALSGRSVMNLAISGGGPLTSFDQYARSAEFNTLKPKYLIWEFTASNLPDDNFAAGRSALLRSSCSASYRPTKAAFRPGMNRIASAADIARVASDDAAVQLQLSSENPAFRNFAIQLNYVDGHQKAIKMDTRRAPTASTSYTVVLPDDHALISDISLINVDPLTGSVSTQLCPAGGEPGGSASTTTASSQSGWLGRIAAWFKSFWG
jgi:hypothetical protein